MDEDGGSHHRGKGSKLERGGQQEGEEEGGGMLTMGEKGGEE